MDSMILDSDESLMPDSSSLAEHRLRMLAYLAWRRAATSGRFPEAIEDVLPDTSRWRGHIGVVDVWGRPIEYVASRDSAIFGSVGADGVAGTRDDIRVTTTRAANFSVQTAGRHND